MMSDFLSEIREEFVVLFAALQAALSLLDDAGGKEAELVIKGLDAQSRRMVGIFDRYLD